MAALFNGKPGARFEIVGLGITGTLDNVNDCSALVRYDNGHTTRIAPATVVRWLHEVPATAAAPVVAPYAMAPTVRWCGYMGWQRDDVLALCTHYQWALPVAKLKELYHEGRAAEGRIAPVTDAHEAVFEKIVN